MCRDVKLFLSLMYKIRLDTIKVNIQRPTVHYLGNSKGVSTIPNAKKVITPSNQLFKILSMKGRINLQKELYSTDK